ncbi:unnamed protein product [Protopolystoma xenopodis]|uniref:Uncharacterized protein n=1 Tax=Protopolystoma xenopodis TaxID=117903 RepID=A0A3S4ZXU2_9PLAT|nr:unnamed protein product [Protopolystoma xenopodis]
MITSVSNLIPNSPLLSPGSSKIAEHHLLCRSGEQIRNRDHISYRGVTSKVCFDNSLISLSSLEGERRGQDDVATVEVENEREFEAGVEEEEENLGAIRHPRGLPTPAVLRWLANTQQAAAEAIQIAPTSTASGILPLLNDGATSSNNNCDDGCSLSTGMDAFIRASTTPVSSMPHAACRLGLDQPSTPYISHLSSTSNVTCSHANSEQIQATVLVQSKIKKQSKTRIMAGDSASSEAGNPTLVSSGLLSETVSEAIISDILLPTSSISNADTLRGGDTTPGASILPVATEEKSKQTTDQYREEPSIITTCKDGRLTTGPEHQHLNGLQQTKDPVDSSTLIIGPSPSTVRLINHRPGENLGIQIKPVFFETSRQLSGDVGMNTVGTLLAGGKM